MSSIRIDNDPDASYTLLPDLFIEQHMPRANGEFVKIYIYLLRLFQQKRTQFSLSDTADVFSCTETDIARAISYWEQRGLIEVSRTEDGDAIAGIRLVRERRENAGRDVRTVAPSDRSHTFSLTNDRTNQLVKDQSDVRQIVMIAEEYLGRTLSSSDLNRLLYLYDELGFSVDLIDYLIEYCVLKGKRSMHYIEKVGLEWYNDGVKTVADARGRTEAWSRDYFRILRAFGISNRNPVTREIDYMRKWLSEYGISMELIEEACSRTVTQTGRSSFDYADRIVTAWHEAGAHTLKDVAALDQRHLETQSSRPAGKPGTDNAGGASRQSRRSRGGSNQFNNFNQRSYDFDALEQQLLGQNKSDPVHEEGTD